LSTIKLQGATNVSAGSVQRDLLSDGTLSAAASATPWLDFRVHFYFDSGAGMKGFIVRGIRAVISKSGRNVG